MALQTNQTSPLRPAPQGIPGNFSGRRTAEYKSIVLNALIIASGFYFGYFYFQYLSEAISAWPMIGALAAFSVFSVIRMVAARDLWGMVAMIFFESAVLCGPFLLSNSFRNFSLVTLVIFVFLLWGEVSGRRELALNLELRFFRIARIAINKITTGATLMIVVLYLPVAMSGQTLVSRSAFDILVGGGAGLVRLAYPDYNSNLTVGAAAHVAAMNQVGSDPAFLALPEAAQNVALNTAVSSTIANFNESLHLNLTAQEPIQSAAYDYLTATLNAWHDRFGDWFLVGWVAVMFLVIRSIGFFFSVAASFVALVVFYLLVAMRVIGITGETRTKEVAKL